MKKESTPEPAKDKTTYQKIISGELEPVGPQKGWANLEAGRLSFNQMEPERAREIQRKGAEAVNRIHGEKKTAREALERILTIKATPEIIAGADIPEELAERLRRDNPDATLYDLIQIVAVGRAVGGNMKAYELIRDTHGDKPIERVEVTENVTTEADRELMRDVLQRLTGPDVVIAKDITGDDAGSDPE